MGTRPNLIKITQLEKEFNKAENFTYKLLHTGQHYDYSMNQIFFEQLEIRKPDYFLNVKGENQLEIIAQIINRVQKPLLEYQPDLVLVPGDVNSTFAVGFAANRMGFKVAHIESGLRSFDRGMPEEINRILVDTISDLFFISEPSGLKHLKDEGKNTAKLHFVGNTMIDTLVAFSDNINNSTILGKIKIEKHKYALLTFHRPRNVDNVDNLKLILETINTLSEKIPLVFPIHPRTRKNIKRLNLEHLLPKDNLVFTEPLGYFDFLKLIKEATMIVTDSGGIQEESTFLQVPCLTVRPNTERPITITEGTNQLLKLDKALIIEKVEEILRGNSPKGKIPENWDGKASQRIVEIIEKIL